MTYEQVIQGIGKYIVKNVLPTMNTWQQVVATVAVDRYMKNAGNLKPVLMNNPMVKALGIMDDSGSVDVDGLVNDIKSAMAHHGDISFSVPIIGCKLRFNPDDLEVLRAIIKEGAGSYENN